MQGFFNKSLAQSDVSTEGTSKIGYGARIGLTSSAFTNYEDTVFSEFGAGVSISAFGTYQINDMFFVSAELSYINRKAVNINQGIIFNTESPLFSAEYISESKTNIVLHNIETAIKINGYLPTGDKNFKPRIFIGNSLGYIFKANAITERTYVMDNIATVSKYNVTERFKAIDDAFILGCGADINMDTFEITVDLDYKFGLCNINNVQGYAPFSSNTLELMVGVKF